MTEYISTYHILTDLSHGTTQKVTVSLSINLGSHWHVGLLQMRAHNKESKSRRILKSLFSQFSQTPGPDDYYPHPFPHRRHSAEATK